MDMSSSSSTASMSMTSMTMSSGMSMPTSSMSMNSSSSMDMTGMDLMGMDMMAMVFFTSSSTPLFSWSWTPTSIGAYAGTCIFLIVLAALFRGMLLIRARVWGKLATQKYSITRLGDKDDLNTTGNRTKRSWRADFAVMIAAIDTVLAGVGYLLMLAVMTMNVGYFISTLAGVFVGSMLFNQFAETTMGTSCY